MSALQFHYFHLMPWPHLPADFDDTYDSAWVTLPNAIYDPEKGHALYNRYFDEIERADKMGWDSVIVNEHHQNAYGTMPSPNIMAAVLTQRVKRAKIGIVGNALPLHDDPLRVAEELAMLDVITIQQPLPIWLPGTASMETIDFAAKHRYPYMTVFMPMEQRKMAYGLYRRLAEEKYGYEATPEQLAFCVPVVVAETDDLARKEAERYLMWLFQRGLKVRPEFNFPPGYVSQNSMRAVLMSGALTRQRPTLQQLIDTGVVIVGSVDTVIEKLAYYSDELRAGMLVTGGHVGEIPDYLVLKNQEMMAKEIMPHFRPQASVPAARPVEVQAAG